MNVRIIFTTSLLGSLFIACSGAAPSDLVDSAGSSQFGTDPIGNPSSTNGGSNAASSGSGGSSGGTTDAGSGGGVDAGTSDSGGGAGTGAGIYCGTDTNNQAVYCNVKSEECCGSHQNGDPSLTFACIPNGGSCQGTPIHCDDQTDCPSMQVCCGQFQQNAGYVSVECKSTCPSTGNMTGVRLCDPNAAVDECLSINKTCSESGSLTGFYRCN